jgi:hypothetical protein
VIVAEAARSWSIWKQALLRQGAFAKDAMSERNVVAQGTALLPQDALGLEVVAARLLEHPHCDHKES